MNRHRFISHGWLIVATGLSVHALGYGARYSFAVIFPSLLQDLNWPRDVTAAMLSFNMLVYGLAAPAAGYLVDTIGPRKTMTSGTLLLTLGLATSRWGREPWHFYISFGVLSGAGLCLMGTVPFTTLIKNWFEKRRGLAFSLLFAGGGGAFASYPAIGFLINSVGWRNTFLVEAIIIAGLILPLIVLIIRSHPQDKWLFPGGMLEAGGTSPITGGGVLPISNHPSAARSWTLFRAAKTGRFWLLCLSTFSLWGMTEHIIVAHHVAFATDLGYSRIYACSILSLFGIFFACGSLAGLVSDRIGREPAMTIGTVIGISGILVLTLIRDASEPWMLAYYAMALGFGFGITMPTVAASITDIFQGPKVGTIIGCIWFSFAIGGFIGPWLGGWIFELTNDYLFAFVLAIMLFAVACGAIWLAAPRKVRAISARSP